LHTRVNDAKPPNLGRIWQLLPFFSQATLNYHFWCRSTMESTDFSI
jgi:hypothetical protein